MRLSLLKISILILFFFSIPLCGQTTEQSPDKIFSKALIDYTDGRHQESINKFMEIINNYPKFNKLDDVFYWVGMNYKNIKKYEFAIQYFYVIIVTTIPSREIPQMEILMGFI